jgi:hypothetical protein
MSAMHIVAMLHIHTMSIVCILHIFTMCISQTCWTSPAVEAFARYGLSTAPCTDGVTLARFLGLGLAWIGFYFFLGRCSQNYEKPLCASLCLDKPCSGTGSTGASLLISERTASSTSPSLFAVMRLAVLVVRSRPFLRRGAVAKRPRVKTSSISRAALAALPLSEA